MTSCLSPSNFCLLPPSALPNINTSSWVQPGDTFITEASMQGGATPPLSFMCLPPRIMPGLPAGSCKHGRMAYGAAMSPTFSSDSKLRVASNACYQPPFIAARQAPVSTRTAVSKPTDAGGAWSAQTKRRRTERRWEERQRIQLDDPSDTEEVTRQFKNTPEWKANRWFKRDNHTREDGSQVQTFRCGQHKRCNALLRVTTWKADREMTVELAGKHEERLPFYGPLDESAPAESLPAAPSLASDLPSPNANCDAQRPSRPISPNWTLKARCMNRVDALRGCGEIESHEAKRLHGMIAFADEGALTGLVACCGASNNSASASRLRGLMEIYQQQLREEMDVPESLSMTSKRQRLSAPQTIRWEAPEQPSLPRQHIQNCRDDFCRIEDNKSDQVDKAVYDIKPTYAAATLKREDTQANANGMVERNSGHSASGGEPADTLAESTTQHSVLQLQHQKPEKMSYSRVFFPLEMEVEPSGFTTPVDCEEDIGTTPTHKVESTDHHTNGERGVVEGAPIEKFHESCSACDQLSCDLTRVHAKSNSTKDQFNKELKPQPIEAAERPLQLQPVQQQEQQLQNHPIQAREQEQSLEQQPMEQSERQREQHHVNQAQADKKHTDEAQGQQVVHEEEHVQLEVGILVSEIKDQWRCAYAGRPPLQTYIERYNLGHLTFLLVQTPNLVLIGAGPSMRVATVVHAKKFCHTYPPTCMKSDGETPALPIVTVTSASSGFCS